VRADVRPSRAILQAYRSIALVAFDPLVGCLAADAKAGAELSQREEASLVISNETDYLVRLLDGTVHTAELHWYEAHGIGRREMKIKFPLLD